MKSYDFNYKILHNTFLDKCMPKMNGLNYVIMKIRLNSLLSVISNLTFPVQKEFERKTYSIFYFSICYRQWARRQFYELLLTATQTADNSKRMVKVAKFFLDLCCIHSVIVFVGKPQIIRYQTLSQKIYKSLVRNSNRRYLPEYGIRQQMSTGTLTAQKGLRVSVGEKDDPPNRRTNSEHKYLL
jgi:hypothetical protein